MYYPLDLWSRQGDFLLKEIYVGLMLRQPVYTQNDIKFCQVKLIQFSQKVVTTNLNRTINV